VAVAGAWGGDGEKIDPVDPGDARLAGAGSPLFRVTGGGRRELRQSFVIYRNMAISGSQKPDTGDAI
jgi:hypothetical protein